MTQDSSLSSPTAKVNNTYHNKCLPKGIHIIGADDKSVSGVGGIPLSEEASSPLLSEETPSPNEAECHRLISSSPTAAPEESRAPWGYIYIRHMTASVFEKNLATREIEGNFRPRCFVHRTMRYRKKANGKGIIKENKPTFSGMIFLQGETRQLRLFLHKNYPDYYLVNDCSTGRPASIADSVMRPFMRIVEEDPERVTFLRDPFEKFAKDHVKLRVLTGILAGQEGYVVRILRDRQLVMDLGGYAVAINNVHNEDFEIAE